MNFPELMRVYLRATTTLKKELLSMNLISLPLTREQVKKSNDSTGRKGLKFFCSFNLRVLKNSHQRKKNLQHLGPTSSHLPIPRQVLCDAPDNV